MIRRVWWQKNGDKKTSILQKKGCCNLCMCLAKNTIDFDSKIIFQVLLFRLFSFLHSPIHYCRDLHRRFLKAKTKNVSKRKIKYIIFLIVTAHHNEQEERLASIMFFPKQIELTKIDSANCRANLRTSLQKCVH